MEECGGVLLLVKLQSSMGVLSFLYLITWYDFAAWSRPFLILLSGDIETNPRPISGQSFLICH